MSGALSFLMGPSEKMHKAIRRITVPPIGDGYQLDALIKAYLALDAAQSVRQAMKLGLVTNADHAICQVDRIVSTGDVLRLDLNLLAEQLVTPPKLSPIFENEDMLVLDKAANQLVHPAGGGFEWTVIDVVRLNHPHADIDLCHRLDRQTSGVLVLTKNKRANALIKRAFEARSVVKNYRAIVSGDPSNATFSCNDPIGHANDDSRVRRKISSYGQSAHTDFIVQQRCTGFAQLECKPITGRSHQIRVHLAHLGLPIIGDRLYADSRALAKNATALQAVHPERHALHCEALELSYQSHRVHRFTAEVPADMLQTWEFCVSNVSR
jgi:23S rRNA pseudouridine1911/1915/1917 synthase